MKDQKTFDVFIASPGDLLEERRIVREVCNELKRSTFLKAYRISFEAVGWEDAFPAPGRPQEIINRLIKECDIFVCMFHRRFGTYSGKEESGTLEEFLDAYDSWKSCKKPHILFYFKEVKVRTAKDLQDPQLQKVMNLKEKIEEERLLLFDEFSTAEEFRGKIKDHLEKWVIATSKGWQRVGDQIEKAFEEDKAFKGYLDSALIEHRHLPTQGFETTLRIPIELENVFINMHANIHTHEFDLTVKGQERMLERIRAEKISSLDIRGAFETSERRKIKDMVILGKPGCGKTTLLKYILVMLIEKKGIERLGIEENVIPLFAPLRELKDPDKESFITFIRRVCCLGDHLISEDHVKELLENGRGIILLDGLDEVANEETRIRTCKWIDKARKRYVRTKFLITSRYAGYMGKSRLEGALLELSIQDFTPHEVREFLVRWFEAVEVALHLGDDERQWRKKGREKALALVDRIDKSKHLVRLAVNPLLLQIIALVHRDRGTLPQRRVELYEECTNVLLEKWDMAKGVDVLLTAREARQVLQPLALWLHEVDNRRSAPMNAIKEVITGPLEEVGKSTVDPEALLLNIRDRSGIFMGYSADEYGFTHLSFQEYLSAEQIRNERLLETLISHYSDRWWREVILLCLGLDNPSVIEEFIQKVIVTEDFTSEIGVVVDALADSIKKPIAPFVAAIKNQSLPRVARSNAIRVLATIGGDRVVRILRETVAQKDKRLASSAYEALEFLDAVKGIARPLTENVPPLFVNPIDDAEMVLISAGSFLYGSRDDDESANSNEKPQRTIDLPTFYMDAFPVTNEQFCRFLNEKETGTGQLVAWINLQGSYQTERCRIRKTRTAFAIEKGYERHPAIYVTWHGARAYAQWAGKRLPSEQEWEKAARGTDGRIYPWGNQFDKDLCNSEKAGIGGTTEVGRFPNGKSPYGCYDMVGNVWEWTDSWYDERRNMRVLRGGSWTNPAFKCRCALRDFFNPFSGWNTPVGFRCARMKKG